ncbi:hypothetical protein O6H91_09G000600 [Diphasiastrum complanatum]|uniref:Uncharacterized protein n=1 Tax=Diphasiastrum complanatum TaxID=34168 RepID=A0ACC2CKR6_DIPCM|nr:hypothetical protein O6H91_Y483900 [Diphasiastrum complanatum]KAJ7542560.1 hypothetical protein O6H91_09G000600 [Diphasiastrum complanatum]
MMMGTMPAKIRAIRSLISLQFLISSYILFPSLAAAASATNPNLHTHPQFASCEQSKDGCSSSHTFNRPLKEHEATDKANSAFSFHLTNSFMRDGMYTRISDDDGSHFRDLWPKFELNWRLVIGTAVGIVGGAVGSVGGVGGGGFFLPMFNLILGFDTKTSAALSKVSLQSVFKKAIALRNQEALSLKDGMMTVPNSIASIPIDEEIESSEHKPVTNGNAILEMYEERRDWSWFPFQKWLLLLFIWAIFLLLQVLKMHTATCGLWYWIIDGLQVPVAIGSNLAFAVHLYNKSKHNDGKEDVNQPLLEQPQNKWRVANLCIYAASGVGAGIVGGLLGLGGGAIMGPAFLELGLSPQVTSATSTFLMVYSSSLSVVEYYLLDRLPTAFAIYFSILSLVAALWGQVIIRKIVTSSGKASVIVFVLGCCMVMSTIFLGGTGAIRSYNKWKTGANLWFDDLCSAR